MKKSKTKIKILAAARKLFNEQGFSQVTIRMIAMELNMSAGNLNYHYKTREEILEALYFEMVEMFDTRVKDLGNTPITFATIQADMLSSLRQMLDYRFIWTDLYNLLRINEKMKHHFEQVYQDRYKGYEFLFDYLQQKEWMAPFDSKKEKHLLIERMIALSNTSLYNSFIYDNEIDEQELLELCHQLMYMFHPYLTPLGKSEFNKEKRQY
ncbi:transcriptional regulator, TetR family [Lishizhenia tianjinensis]|uniref:Transcriptional regulator, TetR family n=1 Tax=Lishizhenia tianjinensis TaxID=477690 RepID=A0A1I6XJS0_9FLAO|nr:TetR/AcrR family transcriptional regulator [Lishizhenia tianjinensis]SFT38599.1 transcriptional regulator, TetR family [Lishizhenia tianjinensis]